MVEKQILLNMGFRILSIDNSAGNIQRLKRASSSFTNQKFNELLVKNIKISNGNEDIVTSMIDQYISKINSETLSNDKLSVFFYLDEYCVLEYDKFNCGFYFPNGYKYGDLPNDIEQCIQTSCNAVESYNLENPELHVIIINVIDKLNPIAIFENI